MAFEPLLDRLAAASGRDLPLPTVEGLCAIFNEIGLAQSEKIVSTIEEMDKVPSNIVGVIRRTWREEKVRIDSEKLWKEKWKVSEEECTSPSEWRLVFQIHEEIMIWHKYNLVKSNPDGLKKACDVLEWKRLGCPKTWSPILDFFLQGFLKVHTGSGKICETFLQGFLDNLKKQRAERLQEMSDRSNNNQKTVINNSHIMGGNTPHAAGEPE